MARRLAASLALLVACAAPGDPSSDEGPAGGKEDRADAKELQGDILATQLVVDVATRHATAVLDVRPDASGRLALDVHGLTIRTVSAPHQLRSGRLLLERLPDPARVTVEYDLTVHDHSDGLLPGGVTLVWPYFCGNLFPCHTSPADGMMFNVDLTGVPDGQVAVVPPRVSAEAPPYMLAWAVGDYTHEALGETSAGTRVGVYYLPRGKTKAEAGTRHLVDVFDWYERTLGPYMFGGEVASVSARWGGGAFGGMEHHPFWHVGEDAMDDEETHAHEAAHGWYGDGVRLRCWEDFVLSEGTVSYLAARALGQVAGARAEEAIWEDYQRRLDDAGAGIAWPRGCNKIDILKDGLFSDIPYMKGAFFYRAVAAEIGAGALDAVLARFYGEHHGQPAGMADMLDAIERDTGFDPGPLAERWLR